VDEAEEISRRGSLARERDTGKLDYVLSVSIPSRPSLKIILPPPLVVRSSTVKLISEDERNDAVDPVWAPIRPSLSPLPTFVRAFLLVPTQHDIIPRI